MGHEAEDVDDVQRLLEELQLVGREEDPDEELQREERGTEVVQVGHGWVGLRMLVVNAAVGVYFAGTVVGSDVTARG